MGDEREPATNWHDEAFFGIHYDLHANADDTELGRELTVEHLVERLERVRPDWIQCDAKGHPGYTSWPTRVGTTSPGVVQDALRIHREATRRLGIPLGVHYSGVWDTRALELHPDWARVDADGVPDGPGRERQGTATTVQRADQTCRLSGYTAELMIPQMLELIDTYDVDGFWVDGENWASRPCWCPRCRAEFTGRTGEAEIPTRREDAGWATWLAFHRDLFVEHVTAYASAVHARKPDCLVCSNWMYTVRQPDAVRAPVDYLGGDFDWAWGADRAAVEGRLLDSRGLSWDLMAWSFIKTGPMGAAPPWVMKTPPHLCQEVSQVVALGGAVMLYDQPQRTGWLTGWHQDLIAEVARFCRLRQDPCFRSRTVPQAAILHLASHVYATNDPLFNHGISTQPLEGALHALLETHHATDILIEEAALDRMGAYQLVVVPEQTNLSEPLQSALTTYAANGGHVVLSGAHLAHEMPDLVGVQPTESAPDDSRDPHDSSMAGVYLPVGRQAVPVSGPWQTVTLIDGTEIRLTQMAQQQPSKDETVRPAITRRAHGDGSIVAIHGPLFRDYRLGHYPPLRDLIRDLIARLDIPWLVTLDAPPRLELILRQQGDRLLINLLNRGAGEALSPSRVVVDELPPVEHITVRLRRPEPPRSVTAIPFDRPLDWAHADGTVTIKVPRVDIHTVVVVE